MNILVIVESIGKTAAGIMAEEFFSELITKNPETLIICNDAITNKIPNEKIIELRLSPIQHNRIDHFLLITTKKDWRGGVWVIKGLNKFNNLNLKFKPDIILSFISSSGFHILKLGYEISKKLIIPFAIHAVDPLPSTPSWGKNPFLRKAIMSVIKPYFEHASLISATNEAMINYQLKVLGLDKKNKNTAVIPNPSQFCKLSNDKNSSRRTISFLYLGSLYLKRSAEKIIKAFINFSNKQPLTNLYFVGNISNVNKKYYSDICENIFFSDWTDNPIEYISKSDVLIDIDADIEGDVFMSSKLPFYLNIDKIVLSITPKNSPARIILENLPETTVLSEHHIKEIEKGFENSLLKSKTVFDYSERKKIRHYFSPKSIVSSFLECLEKI